MKRPSCTLIRIRTRIIIIITIIKIKMIMKYIIHVTYRMVSAERHEMTQLYPVS
jgi:hypothetical protein